MKRGRCQGDGGDWAEREEISFKSNVGEGPYQKEGIGGTSKEWKERQTKHKRRAHAKRRERNLSIFKRGVRER